MRKRRKNAPVRLKKARSRKRRPASVHRIAGVTIPRTHRGAGFRPFAKAWRPKKNPTARWSRETRRRLRRAADRIALAAHGRWDVKRVPDFLKYWVPANRSSASYASRALKDARRGNPKRWTPRAMIAAVARDPDLEAAVDAHGGLSNISMAQFKALVKRLPRPARRRNPWPALVNGFAAGLGLFAANRMTAGAIKVNGRRKRRRSKR